jgi:hypothetical protein
MSITNNNIEHYLGKNISEIRSKISLVEDSYSPIYDKLYKSDNTLFVFYPPEKYKTLFWGINSNNIITSIFFSTQNIIDSNFFLFLVKKYGVPTQMIKMGTITEASKSVSDDYIATSKIAGASHCSFEENPLYIIWNKVNYKIDVNMNYQRNTSLITFELK